MFCSKKEKFMLIMTVDFLFPITFVSLKPAEYSPKLSTTPITAIKCQHTAKLQGLGIAGSLQGKPALPMEKGCKNNKETLCKDCLEKNLTNVFLHLISGPKL